MKKMSCSNIFKYGVPLTDFDPRKEYVYDSFVEYYNDPVMSKIKDDNENNLSVYACKTVCMLINKCRYLLTTVPKDSYSIGKKFNLRDIEWVSFQTRVLEGKYNVPSHHFQTTTKFPMNSKIIEYSKDENITNYNCEHFRVKVHLLHTRENNIWEYTRIGKLCSALETYQTIITF
jgi:hypothetical protein